MKIWITMVDDFQISRISYEDSMTNYWVDADFHYQCLVDTDDPVGIILYKYYGSDFNHYVDLLTTFIGLIHNDPLYEHHGCEIVTFHKDLGRVVLKQHLSWAEQGIDKNFHVIRHVPARFKPAKAA